jgi:PadR family transcriptional regulator, regulatory protein AphA
MYNTNMIRYILLGYLKYYPMSGYDLKLNLEHSISHFWHAHHSQIYTTMRKLEEEGLVTSKIHPQEGAPDRRVYSITEAGKEEVNRWLDKPMKQASPIKEEFMVRLFFSSGRESQEVTAELIMQRKLHEERLQVYKALEHHLNCEIKKEYPVNDRDVKFWLFTLKMGLNFETMYIQWINDTLAELQQMDNQA